TSTSVVPRALALAHRHRHMSPCVRQPFVEISGSISFSPLWFLSRKLCPIFVCQFKGSLHPIKPTLVATYCNWDDVIWMRGQNCHFNQRRMVEAGSDYQPLGKF